MGNTTSGEKDSSDFSFINDAEDEIEAFKEETETIREDIHSAAVEVENFFKWMIILGFLLILTILYEGWQHRVGIARFSRDTVLPTVKTTVVTGVKTGVKLAPLLL